MFILAQTGITAGAVWLISRHWYSREKIGMGGIIGRDHLYTNYPHQNVESMDSVGFRLIILGSVLPDIVDKPIGLFFPQLGLGTGRGMAR
jgi:hypothetical protein